VGQHDRRLGLAGVPVERRFAELRQARFRGLVVGRLEEIDGVILPALELGLAEIVEEGVVAAVPVDQDDLLEAVAASSSQVCWRKSSIIRLP